MSHIGTRRTVEGDRHFIRWIQRGQKFIEKQPVKHEDGTVGEEKIPARPFRRAVNPRGNVVPISLSCGAADRTMDSQYGLRRWQSKLKKGFVPADQCAAANGLLPKPLRKEGDKPCEDWVDEFGMAKTMKRDTKPCEHTQRIIDYRKRKANEKDASRKKRFESPEERNSDYIKQMLEGLQGKPEQRPQKQQGGKV